MNNESYYTVEIASDPNTSPDILRKILKRGNNDRVSRYVAQNPNCPPDTLKMVLERDNNDWVSVNAAENPNCSPEALKMVLERGNNDEVSDYATRNPNCPPLERILWMRSTGRIGVENPNDPKQFIEYEEVKEDTDLQKLRELRDLIA